MHSVNLCQAVKMFPTPTSRDHKDGSAEACKNVPDNGLLGRVIHQNSGEITGSLNPVFVEWLMGVPKGWTDLNVSGTGKFLLQQILSPSESSNLKGK